MSTFYYRLQIICDHMRGCIQLLRCLWHLPPMVVMTPERSRSPRRHICAFASMCKGSTIAKHTCDSCGQWVCTDYSFWCSGDCCTWRVCVRCQEQRSDIRCVRDDRKWLCQHHASPGSYCHNIYVCAGCAVCSCVASGCTAYQCKYCSVCREDMLRRARRRGHLRCAVSAIIIPIPAKVSELRIKLADAFCYVEHVLEMSGGQSTFVLNVSQIGPTFVRW